MVQLNKYGYSHGGAPLFDQNGKPAGVGPLRQVDVSAVWLRPADDPDESTPYYDVGPLSDPKSFILYSLDNREPPTDNYDQGCHKLLRLFVDWMPIATGTKESKFVLSHPDFNYQNMLVTSEGDLCGLIDWDGVAAVPRGAGNLSYPSWLTRDWDPTKYAYESIKDGHMEGQEQSPEELSYYRSMYLQYIEKYNPDEDGGRVTRNSIVIECLWIAAIECICTYQCVGRVYNEIVRTNPGGSVTNPPEDSDCQYFDIICALGDGDLDQRRLRWLKSGFEALFA